jgi:RHS repeat-associated protein
MMVPRKCSPAQRPTFSRNSSGKERDETNLDYFGARYFSGALGRFTSSDPDNAGSSPHDPHSWNAYAYSRNNPFKYTDPDGLAYMLCTPSGNCEFDYPDLEFFYNFWYLNGRNGLSLNGDLYSGNIFSDGKYIGYYFRTSIEHQPDGAIADATLDTVITVTTVASIPSMIRGGFTFSRALVRGIGKLFSREAASITKATVRDILKGAVRQGGSRAEIFSKNGGLNQAVKDFESLGGTTKTVGRIKYKDLPNGEGRAVLRSFSKDGRPTLEIQPAGGGYKGIAIRYN